MSGKLLIVYVKNPIPGKVKSRLAQQIGEERACEVYKQLLVQIKEQVKKLNIQVRISFYDSMINDQLWTDPVFQKIEQIEGDLGVRMNSDFESAFKDGYDQVSIIGSDIYKLSDSIINQAFLELDSHDCVIGPSFDGGYYLIGFNSGIVYSETMKNISWSTKSVFSETISILAKMSISYVQLEFLRDIDYVEDLPEELSAISSA